MVKVYKVYLAYLLATLVHSPTDKPTFAAQPTESAPQGVGCFLRWKSKERLTRSYIEPVRSGSQKGRDMEFLQSFELRILFGLPGEVLDLQKKSFEKQRVPLVTLVLAQ